jgi:hypothetical protein
MSDNTTPRPWSTSREDMDSFTVNQDDTTGETEHVVYIYRGDQPRIAVFAGALNNARADANFIVEAVNSWSDRVARAMANETPPAADPRVAEAVKALDGLLTEAKESAGDIFHDTWNPDAHVELTLTIAELRGLTELRAILTAQAGDAN